MLVNDIPRADLSNVYAGISKDLESAATKPKDQMRWQRSIRRIRSINKGKPISTNSHLYWTRESPRSSFTRLNTAAGTGGGANAGLLTTLKSNIPQGGWDQVGASVVKNLGTPPAGAQDALEHAAWSPSSFATNWNKLSPEAKDTLFGANTPGSNRADLEDLARVSQAQKNVAGFANHSNSASHAGIAGLGVLAMEHAPELLHEPHMLLPWVGSAVGANGVARALMTPGFARWLYRSSQNNLTTPQAVAQLTSIARMSPGLQPIAQQLSASANQ